MDPTVPDRTWRDELLAQLDSQMSLVLTLSEQAQARAQIASSSLTVLISIGALIFSTIGSVRNYVAANHILEWLVAGLTLLLISLLLNIIASTPLNLGPVEPKSFKQLAEASEFLNSRIRFEELESRERIADFDNLRVEEYSQILKSVEWRGSIILLAQAMLIAAIIEISLVLVIPSL